MMRALWQKNKEFLLLAGLVIALYASTLQAPWLPWDDDNNIFNNVWFLKGQWLLIWKMPYYGLYIPVTSTVWNILFHLGHGSTIPFRIFNLLLHLTNVALVFSLAKRFYSKYPQGAFAAGLIFALHPVQVGAVAWISGSRDLLATAFALSAVLVFFSERPRRRGEATAFFVLSLLSKPQAVVLPLVLWLMTRERLMLLWLTFSAVLFAVTTSAQKLAFQDTTPMWFRPILMFDAFGFQLQKLVAPVLAIDYGRLPAKLYADPSLWLSTVATSLSILLLLALFSKRFPNLRWGWAWFLLMLPVSGIVITGFQEISTVVDHYQYLPMAALVLALVPWLEGSFARVALVSLAFLWCGLSLSRIQVWTSEERFYSDMIEKNPNSFSASIGLGNLAFKKNDSATAAEWYQKAILQRPFDVVGLSNYAAALYDQKRFELAYELRNTFALPEVKKKMQANPVPTASLMTSVGSSAVELGHMDEGFKYICESARMMPENARFQKNRETVEALAKRPCPSRGP